MVGITSSVERQHAFAISRAGSRLGAMAGSLLAGLLVVCLADRFGLSTESPTAYRYVLYIGPFLNLGMMVLLRSIGPVETPAIQRNRADTRRPIGLFFAMAFFIILSGAAEATGDTYFNVYMDEALRAARAP